MPSKLSGIKIPLHKDLQVKRPKWERVEELLEHDETALSAEPFCNKLPDESAAAYNERQKYFPANFINPSQDLVSAPGDTLFKNGYKVDVDKNSLMNTFIENCTMSNDATAFPRYLRDYISVGLRGYGTTFTVIDKPAVVVKNRYQERMQGMPYMINIRPLDVLSYAFNNGELFWFAYRRSLAADWNDPTNEMPAGSESICVWTKDEYFVVSQKGEVIPEKTVQHNWGFVPVVIQSSFLASPDNILGEWAFDQSSNMIITANNLNHIAVFELYKHGNSLLLMHDESITASNMTSTKQGDTKLKKQAKGRVLGWAGEHEPKFLVKELAVKECREIADYYFQSAIENERDLKSVAAKGTSGEEIQQSGFAKMIDREPLEGNLEALADDLETFSDKVFSMVAEMLKIKNDASIHFDRNFDLRSYKQKLDEIKVAIENRYGEVTPTGMTETFKALTHEITTDPYMQQKIDAELEVNVPVVFGDTGIAREDIFSDGTSSESMITKEPQTEEGPNV